MARPQSLILVSLFLLPLAFRCGTANLDEEAPMKVLPEKKFVVEGMVYCQSCKDLGTESLSGAVSIPYATVSVTCTNHKNQVFYYKEYTTNYYGYFYAELEGFSMGHYLFDHPLTSCKVKLVSSPQESCNIPTNINNGIIGASLLASTRGRLKKIVIMSFILQGRWRSAQLSAFTTTPVIDINMKLSASQDCTWCYFWLFFKFILALVFSSTILECLVYCTLLYFMNFISLFVLN